MTMITEYDEIVRKLMSSTADELTKESGFVKRTRKLSGGSFAQALVFGRLAEPDGTRKQLEVNDIPLLGGMSFTGTHARRFLRHSIIR